MAEVNRETCEICGMCATRCAMDAITARDEPSTVAGERCIGCGLCVTTCPTGAIRLRAKQNRKAPPPKDVGALYTRIFQERYGGQLNCARGSGAQGETGSRLTSGGVTGAGRRFRRNH